MVNLKVLLEAATSFGMFCCLVWDSYLLRKVSSHPRAFRAKLPRVYWNIAAFVAESSRHKKRRETWFVWRFPSICGDCVFMLLKTRRTWHRRSTNFGLVVKTVFSGRLCYFLVPSSVLNTLLGLFEWWKGWSGKYHLSGVSALKQ